MTLPGDRSVLFRLSVQQLTRPELLMGLETWLQLGILSNQQVMDFCQEYLICPLSLAPEVVTDRAPIVLPTPEVAAHLATASDPTAAPVTPDPEFAPVPAEPATRNIFGRSLQSLMAEVSVVWLLFLGVFLVVLSSGVLAATQWRNFSALGQYMILLGYTMAFAMAAFWTGRQAHLHLTSRMLQIATLLIIPLNFWMMDGLKIASRPLGLGLAAIATLLLSALIFALLRPRHGLTSGNHRFIAAHAIALSWLHWGWGWANLPLLATYIGTAGTAIILAWPLRNTRRQADEQALPAESSESASPSPIVPPIASSIALPIELSSTITTPSMLLILMALLLVGRALFAAQLPLSQLGLALGICGGLLCWLIRQGQIQIFWRWAGVGLLLLGWGVAVSAEPPWQAVGISVLGLWLLQDYLIRHWNSNSLIALILVGLQTYVLLWWLIPASLRQTVLNWATQVAGDRGMPDALLGLSGFPAVLLLLGLAAWLRQQRTAEISSGSASFSFQALPLAQQTEILALVLGLGLTLMSSNNSLVRSLNLTLSALTLLYICRHRLVVLPCLYLAHLTAIGGVLSWIDWCFPELTQLNWARVLLVGAIAEWGLSISTLPQRWRRSAWILGLGLAGLGESLLSSQGWHPEADYGNLVGLLVPIALAGLARSPRCLYPQLAAWLSTATLIVQLPLLHLLNAWLISLGIATGLMLLNTRKLRHPLAALLTVGFGLGFETVALAVQFSEQITLPILLNLMAMNLWLLWVSRQALMRQQSLLRSLYALAVELWAIVGSVLTLLLLTFISLYDPTGPVALATTLTLAAIAYRLWQQPTSPGFYGLAWSAEILAMTLVALTNGQATDIAIATLGLGLAAQIAGTGWVRRSGQAYASSWHIIPLLYAVLGGLIGHTSFTAGTGLYTLAVALIGLGVGRRAPVLKPLTLISLLLISIAASELLIYQLLQAEGGKPGDGVVLLAGLALVIAGIEWRLDRPLQAYLRLRPQELLSLAHLHWAVGSGLIPIAAALNLSLPGSLIGIGVTAGLAGYALMMGRSQTARLPLEPSTDLPEAPSTGTEARIAAGFSRGTAELWIYAGIIEAIALLSYGLYRFLPDAAVLWHWAGAIAAVIAIGLYFLPWNRWGWELRPWQNTAKILPGLAVLLTAGSISTQSLLIVAAFYAWLAKSIRLIRLSYGSILLLDWAILRYLAEHHSLNLLGWGMVLGGSLLYVAQVDPALQAASAREQRHWVRSLATALICLTALYQAEVAGDLLTGLLVLGLSLALIFLGLVLRMRAFLYIGTATFILRVLRFLWLFINTNSALLWAVGIVLGLLLIWIAATFEARRHQVTTLLQYWVTELTHWE